MKDLKAEPTFFFFFFFLATTISITNIYRHEPSSASNHTSPLLHYFTTTLIKKHICLSLGLSHVVHVLMVRGHSYANKQFWSIFEFLILEVELFSVQVQWKWSLFVSVLIHFMIRTFLFKDSSVFYSLIPATVDDAVEGQTVTTSPFCCVSNAMEVFKAILSYNVMMMSCNVSWCLHNYRHLISLKISPVD